MSVVARQAAVGDGGRELLGQLVLAREGFDALVDQPDDLGVDVRADHGVALVGELDGQRETDLAQGYDGDAHDGRA